MGSEMCIRDSYSSFRGRSIDISQSYVMRAANYLSGVSYYKQIALLHMFAGEGFDLWEIDELARELQMSSHSISNYIVPRSTWMEL